MDGINSHASELSKFLEVSNNNFKEVDVGMYFAGTHDFRVVDNKIENDFAGIHLWDSGLGISEINCNTLEQLDMSITAEGDCSGVQVLDNGFISVYSDLALFDVNGQAGKLFESQGQEDMPANNCFSPGGALHLASFGNTVPYTYYVPDDVPTTDCRIPSSTGGNDVEITNTSQAIECERPLIGPGDDKNAYLDLLNQYQIASGGGTPPQGQTWASVSVYNMRRQLRVGLQQWLRNGLLNGTSTDLEDVLIATDPDEGLKQLYGLHLQRGEWTQAQQYLTQIRSDVKNTTFAEVQDINLVRLQMTTSTFVPTPAQWTTLEQAALTNSPAGNYAKGLLSLMRGDDFPSDLTLPSPQAFQATPPSTTENIATKIRIFPNPTTGRLFVRFPYTETGSVRLIDQVGRVVLNRKIAATSGLELDVVDFVDGIYYLELITTTLAAPVTKSIIINH